MHTSIKGKLGYSVSQAPSPRTAGPPYADCLTRAKLTFREIITRYGHCHYELLRPILDPKQKSKHVPDHKTSSALIFRVHEANKKAEKKVTVMGVRRKTHTWQQNL